MRATHHGRKRDREDFLRKSCRSLFLSPVQATLREERFDNKDCAILAQERATGVKKRVTIKDIKHYGSYNEACDQARKEAIAWFDEHLKRENGMPTP